jgi:hypothetical protein
MWAPGTSPESGQRREVLAGGQRGIQPGPVHEARHALGSVERPPDRRSQNLQAAAVRDGEAQQQPQQGGLAGAVRTDQAVDLARSHVEIDAVESDDITEGLGDLAGPDDRG